MCSPTLRRVASPGSRGVESRDCRLDLVGRRRDVGGDESGSPESAQRDDEELEVGELAGQELLVLGLAAAQAPRLQGDGPAAFVGEAAGAFEDRSVARSIVQLH